MTILFYILRGLVISSTNNKRNCERQNEGGERNKSKSKRETNGNIPFFLKL